MVIQFLQGARRTNVPRPRTVPHWDLPTIMRALKGPPFEPLQSSSLRVLSLETTLLLTLAYVKRVGDLQALSINPACLEFGPNDSKVVLKPLLGYVPKMLYTPLRAQVIAPSAFSPSVDSQESLLCPVRALKVYIERSGMTLLGSPCAWCILRTPLGLIPCDSWFQVISHRSTA